MAAYTTQTVRNAAAALTSEAIRAGLIPAGDALIYSRGSRVNGNAPGIDISDASGIRPAHFIPRFTHKSTAREVTWTLDGARAALCALRNI